MAVTPEDELAEARERLEGDREIDFRHAARGAYYAALHALQNVVSELPAVLSFDGGSHEHVIANLKHSRDARVRSLGFMLQDCRGRRVDADYHTDKDFTRESAALQIETVDRIFSRVREIGKDKLLRAPPNR